MKALPVSVVLLVILGTAACGSAPADTPGSPTVVSPAPQAEATPTPEVGEANQTTVAQWASEIAKLRSSYDDMQESWDGATCSALAVPDAPDCSAWMVAMGFTAQAVQITLDGLQKETGPTYLGGVPAEIAPLLAETTAAAQVAAEASKAVACPGDNCVGTAFTFERAWDDLGTSLAGWDPYL